MGLWDELTDSGKFPQTVWAWDGTDYTQTTIGTEILKARQVAESLRRLGVREGDVVPAVITNGPDATTGFMGIWLAGATIASLPIIARGMSIESYVAQLDRLCDLVGSRLFLAEERFLAFLPDDASLKAVPIGYRKLLEGPPIRSFEPPDVDKTIFIQFSSGTTAEPRGVRLTGRAIEAQLRMLARHLEIDPERDVGYMWLPLSHDMGFFGCSLLALYTGIRGVRATPERFLQSPSTWFNDCARFGATLTAGPPSAIHVATCAEQAKPTYDPLRLRLCLVGAEQVDCNVLAACAQTFARRGMCAETFTVAYGLAEATLAVTVGELAEAPRYVPIDTDELANGRFVAVDDEDETARRITSVGKPVGTSTVEIDPTNSEVVIGSPSLADGYLNQPEVTSERFCEGTVRTRDLGFMHDGELFLVGRSDDVLIVGGRNVYVHDLERMMGAERGVRPGNCAIVDIGNAAGRARIGVVAEITSSARYPDQLTDRLRHLAMTHLGLPVDDVLFLDRGTFPKTPSGKVQRYRCREILRRSRASGL